jgi:HPt (histidine-containing phosphotransfer) domain-containing protein
MSSGTQTGWVAFLAAHPEVYPAEQTACLLEMIGFAGPDFVAELLEDLWRDGGTRSLEMGAALAAGDAPNLERSAHTLKSMARTLGFERLGAACTCAELIARNGRLDDAAGHVAQVAWEMEAVGRLMEEWG